MFFLKFFWCFGVFGRRQQATVSVAVSFAILVNIVGQLFWFMGLINIENSFSLLDLCYRHMFNVRCFLAFQSFLLMALTVFISINNIIYSVLYLNAENVKRSYR